MKPTLEELQMIYGYEPVEVHENRRVDVPLWLQKALLDNAPKKKRHFKKLLKKQFMQALKRGMKNG